MTTFQYSQYALSKSRGCPTPRKPAKVSPNISQNLGRGHVINAKACLQWWYTVHVSHTNTQKHTPKIHPQKKNTFTSFSQQLNLYFLSSAIRDAWSWRVWLVEYQPCSVLVSQQAGTGWIFQRDDDDDEEWRRVMTNNDDEEGTANSPTSSKFHVFDFDKLIFSQLRLKSSMGLTDGTMLKTMKAQSMLV